MHYKNLACHNVIQAVSATNLSKTNHAAPYEHHSTCFEGVEASATRTMLHDAGSGLRRH